MVAMGQKQVAAEARSAGETAAIQARKGLTAMGLTYYDKGQFLDAVKGGDALAARLFLLGRGVDPAAENLFGRSALDLAQRRGNPEMIALLSDALASGDLILFSTPGRAHAAQPKCPKCGNQGSLTFSALYAKTSKKSQIWELAQRQVVEPESRRREGVALSPRADRFRNLEANH